MAVIGPFSFQSFSLFILLSLCNNKRLLLDLLSQRGSEYCTLDIQTLGLVFKHSKFKAFKYQIKSLVQRPNIQICIFEVKLLSVKV
jgi:hypothetical protein